MSALQDSDLDGGSSIPHTSGEIKDLKDQNEQQQLLIAQLKEMLRKEQSTVPQEKVEEYVNTLNKAKAKRSKLKKHDSGTTEKSSSVVDSNKNQKISLLKQQLEENKAKLAERGMRRKDMEEMVTTLKAQLNDSQQLINSTPGNLSYLEKTLEYNKNTNSEELYHILLTKEKKITDLLEKMQKQENHILDLQENLKEKDSVIEARTKAITLMTDNFSLKHKDTVDILDETKEQMRKMQENFITLESEMKARQIVLLNDLKNKNIEITDLQEEIHKLREENETFRNNSDTDVPESEKHEFIIKDLKNKLDESRKNIETNITTINNLKSRIFELENHDTTDISKTNEELEKLKKQIDESNKNMIKIKAQHKSKVKDLNKKLDGFKKMSDANATIIQLQNEITKLNEKIAELEEEKGNMQLKMVESIESLKGSSTSDNVKELQNKINVKLEEIDEKDKIINLLESDIISLKSEIKNLHEKVSGLSQFENEQVTSEMKSIQIEEQLEIVETSNKELLSELELLKKEKEELLQKIDDFAKEKADITSKLDTYIQENIELIDKLEKLSAEKVSSAESIEIVEGLTQQEKLELAAYQKNLDVSLEDPVKSTEEEPSVELSESVLQLTEETTELLKKIEMFNMERKEVMIKLDDLKEENNQLALKLNEVENNRDILAETYEQVQTEKDDLQKENESLVQKLRDLENVDKSRHVSEVDITCELEELREAYEKIVKENGNLHLSIKEFEKKIHEKDNLEKELNEARHKISELDSKLNENIAEITNYQLIIEENKSELINSSTVINELQNKLVQRETDIEDLNKIINDLNKVVEDLQAANSKINTIEDMENQLLELKDSLSIQIELTDTQAAQFKDKLIQIQSYSDQEITKKIEEIEKLSEELAIKEEEINILNIQLKDKDISVKSALEDMRQKYLSLQEQLNNNSGVLQKQLEELNTKNKEQLEKMKKIAANLKKKTQAYQELEEKYKEEKEKWETEINKNETISTDTVLQHTKEIEQLREEITLKSTNLEESKTRINELTSIITTLEKQNVDLQNMLLESQQFQEKVSDISLKQELSTSLHEEFDILHGNNELTYEDKLKELQLIIETNESDLSHFKERSQNLEEELSMLLEEKEKILFKLAQTEEKLLLSTKKLEEKSQLEVDLENKLQELAVSNDNLLKKIQELTTENKELTDKTREQEDLIIKLKIKIKKTQDKINQLKVLQSSIEEQEQANNDLKKQILHLETMQKQMHLEYEEKQKQNQKDYEKIESDYQVQLEELVKNRNDLTFECEKLQEELKNMKYREEELTTELQELKQNFSSSELKVATLTENLTEASNNWQSSANQVEKLQEEIGILQKQLLTNVANNAIIEIISDAKNEVITSNSKTTQTEIDSILPSDLAIENTPLTAAQNFFKQDFPSFQWGEDDNQQKDTTSSLTQAPRNTAISAQESGSFSRSVTKEDLETKIRALDILVYNVEKEKEEVIHECSNMVTELTRIVYDKLHTVDHTGSSPNALLDLESQIMTSDQIQTEADPQTLQKIEFEQTDPCLGEQNEAVIEKIETPEYAYQTYQPEQPINIKYTDNSLRPIGSYPLAEAVGENDDGWGWGPEEARLEEEHQHRSENTPQMQALRSEVQVLREKVQMLGNEKEKYIEEIKQLQLKSNKLIRKCKELKLKNDQLNNQNNTTDFLDLDKTIQDELKTQIEHLETKIKEVTTELNKEKQERTNLLKKMDALSSNNQKMLELKEILDSEIFRWKRKYEEVQEKLDHLDWGSDDFKSPKREKKVNSDESSEDIEELKKLVQDLTVDNEELQALLNDQKTQRVQLERSKSINNEEKIKSLEEEISNKNATFNNLNEEKGKLIKELNEKIHLIQELESQLRQMNSNKYLETTEDIVELKSKLKQTEDDLNETRTELENKNKFLGELEENLKQVQAINENLDKFLKEKENESVENSQLEILTELLTEKTKIADQFQQSSDCLNKEILALRLELDKATVQFTNMQENHSVVINHLTAELEREKKKVQSLDDINPSIQELTKQKASTIRELYELFNYEHSSLQNLKENYDYNVNLINTYITTIKKLEQKLSDHNQQIENLKNIMEQNTQTLQRQLDKEKHKYDQLQIENVEKLKEVFEKIENERKKYLEHQSDTEKDQKIQNLVQLIEDKELIIKELKTAINDEQVKKTKLETEIKQLNDTLNSKQIELERTIKEMENKLVDTIANLEQKWMTQVDERGNTVAESWKYHLSIVESDFAAAQEKLKNEINELEEKCNALVNENNELRKNVDTEIKNEVDRISALQQQINDRQQFIQELKQNLATEQIEKAALLQKSAEFDINQQTLANKEIELLSLKTLAETTRQQFDEKREVVEEIVKILEKNTSYPLSCEKQDILQELNRQLDLSTDKNQLVGELNSLLHNAKTEIENLTSQVQILNSELQSHVITIQEKDAEILRILDASEKQVDKKTNEAAVLTKSINQLKEEMQQIEKNNEEINSLHKQIDEYQMKLTSNEQDLKKVQQLYNESSQTLDNHKYQYGQLQQTQVILQRSIEDKEQHISNLNHQLQQLKENKETEKLEMELNKSKDLYLQLQQSLSDCQQQLFNMTQELASKSHDYETVNQQFVYSQQNTELLQEEVNKLKELLHQKEEEYDKSLTNMKKTHYSELESHYEELMSAKDLDIQTLRAQIAEFVYNTNENLRIKNELEAYISELTNSNNYLQTKLAEAEAKILEQSSLVEEENKQLNEMRGIIEEQVIKIEELKKELFEKSNDYDSLIAEMDISRKAVTQQPQASSTTAAPTEKRLAIPEDDLSEPVNRAELDLALYMLHQRDVRCEELTVELTQLLEERDTLQLRLSNSIREKEELRRKLTKVTGTEVLPTSSTEVTTESQYKQSRTSEILLAASGTELASEASEKLLDQEHLANKLSELKQVGYKRDKTFVDEQEMRRMQQISIMEQHIREASKLPPEAAAKLVDASYTLSRDVQSPSKVLLNWLWGRSTPKVNDT